MKISGLGGELLGIDYRPSTGQLYGVVRAASNCSPLAGVRIELWLDSRHRATQITGADGRYWFASARGRIYIRVTRPGYSPLMTSYGPRRGVRKARLDLVLLAPP